MSLNTSKVNTSAAKALFAGTPAAGTGKVMKAPAGPDTSSLEAQIAALRAENEALKEKRNAVGAVYLKVSGKGAVSIYGLGRFPITLYSSAVKKLFAPENAAQVLLFTEYFEEILSNKSDEKIEVPKGYGLTPKTDAFTLGHDFEAWAAGTKLLESKLVKVGKDEE